MDTPEVRHRFTSVVCKTGRLLSSFCTASLLLLLSLLPACGDDGPGNNNQSGCPEGHRAEGPACVPIFDDPDDCPGPNEMPALGGGCRPVGVLQCATGFVADGEGGCEPILPSSPGPGVNPCPPGTMEMIGHAECQPVGVIQCAEGFVADGEGGCDAILPPGPDPCPPGTIERIGFETCQPLGDCGPDPSQGGSPWGLVEVDGTTVFVDATADASGASGTAAAPFPTVAAAIAAVQSGGQIAIAAGEYEEILMIDKPMRLVGRCSSLVTLRGRTQLGQPRPALSITAGGTGSEVRGVTLTGPGEGLVVDGAGLVVVENVEVLGTGSNGVVLKGQAEATLGLVKVANCSTVGIFSQDSTLRLEQSVARDTLSQPGTGFFGRGISAQCSRPDSCGSLHLEENLVSGNRELGIFASGTEATVISTVVKDTLPRESDLAVGVGINAQCGQGPGACGSLRVENSLVSRNREGGIVASGVNAMVVSSVVRDTQALQSDQLSGRGISAWCYPAVGACGSLRVESSLVTDNREIGIFASGAAAIVISSVVRNTLAQERNQTGGRGVRAQCDAELGVCGGLRLERSLITGNRGIGVFPVGIDATVVSSVVRDTLPEESNRTFGRGINAQCDLDWGICGRLHVEGSLIADNRDVGIHSSGLQTTVRSSVVRDTLPQESDDTGGRGIAGQCSPDTGACGSLLVEGSLVMGNRDMGIYAAGVEATVRSSVVRDTQAKQSDQTLGIGIVGRCDPYVGDHGSMLVEGSLVSGNRLVGIHAAGVEATIRSSVVQDTLSQECDQAFGRGINAQCDPDLGICAPLLVEGSLVDGNQELGIFAQGVYVNITSTVVRDTLPRQSDLTGGRGINAQCHPELGACGRLAVTESLVIRSEDVGIYSWGVPAELRSVAVIDTRTNAGGVWEGQHGQGVWAICDSGTGVCGTLSMTSCLVSSSYGAGVALDGASGFMTGSLVDTVLAQPADGKYGYGIQIGGLEGEAMPTFHVRECEVRDAKLVGVLYYRSKGTLSGSVVSGGEYSVAMNEGSSPTIEDDNWLSGTVEDDPKWVSLYPSPAPPPATPSTSME